MKDLQRTTLQAEINRVIGDGNKPVFNNYEIEIHANKKTYKAYAVDEVLTYRNFVGNYHEELTITAMMNSADYLHGIVPYDDKLEATLRCNPKSSNFGISNNDNRSIKVKRYNAYLYDTDSKLVESNSYGVNYSGVAEKLGFTTVQIQLVDKVIEKLRAHRFSTVVKNCSAMDCIMTLLDLKTREYGKEESVEVIGVDVAPGYNKNALKQIVIPTNTPIIGKDRSMPRILNDAQGGIYPTGFSYYYQSGLWYLFPPFATDLYEKSEKTVTIINVPSNKYPSIERTYRLTSTQLVILSSGEVKHRDFSVNAQANEGNGSRWLDARQLMGKFTSIVNNKLVFNGDKNVNEFIVSEREAGPNMMTGGGISTGYGNEYAKLASRTGSYVQLTWEHANPDLINPGMPCRFMYLIKDMPYECYGTVVSVESSEKPQNHDIKNRVFSAVSVITIYIDKVQSPPIKLDG